MGCSRSFASAQNNSGCRRPKIEDPVDGSTSLGLTTSRRGVNIDTGEIEYGVCGRTKWRISSRMEVRGPSSNVDSQLSGAVSGSTRWSVSSGKGILMKVSDGSIEANVSETGGNTGKPYFVT